MRKLHNLRTLGWKSVALLSGSGLLGLNGGLRWHSFNSRVEDIYKYHEDARRSFVSGDVVGAQQYLNFAIEQGVQLTEELDPGQWLPMLNLVAAAWSTWQGITPFSPTGLWSPLQQNGRSVVHHLCASAYYHRACTFIPERGYATVLDDLKQSVHHRMRARENTNSVIQFLFNHEHHRSRTRTADVHSFSRNLESASDHYLSLLNSANAIDKLLKIRIRNNLSICLYASGEIQQALSEVGVIRKAIDDILGTKEYQAIRSLLRNVDTRATVVKFMEMPHDTQLSLNRDVKAALHDAIASSAVDVLHLSMSKNHDTYTALEWLERLKLLLRKRHSAKCNAVLFCVLGNYSDLSLLCSLVNDICHVDEWSELHQSLDTKWMDVEGAVRTLTALAYAMHCTQQLADTTSEQKRLCSDIIHRLYDLVCCSKLDASVSSRYSQIIRLLYVVRCQQDSAANGQRVLYDSLLTCTEKVSSMEMRHCVIGEQVYMKLFHKSGMKRIPISSVSHDSQPNSDERIKMAADAFPVERFVDATGSSIHDVKNTIRMQPTHDYVRGLLTMIEQHHRNHDVA